MQPVMAPVNPWSPRRLHHCRTTPRQADGPAGTPADVQRLETHFYGYNEAYDTLQGDVGGYKKPYPITNQEVKRLLGAGFPLATSINFSSG